LYVFQTSGRALLAPPLQENETALPGEGKLRIWFRPSLILGYFPPK